MAHWFDIGINLTNERLPVDQVVRNALDADVRSMAITGTNVAESTDALALCKRYPANLYSTAGVHPHYAKDVDADFINQLRDIASHPEVIAIGECGLDFNRNFSPPEQQLAVFEQQLLLACELGKPVFLHERDAFDEQIQLLKKYRSKLPGGVAHCFTGNLQQMQAYLELDLFIGVTGWLCDPKRGLALREAVAELPLSHVLLETDGPYLMPKTLKSKNRYNEPANLPHIAETLAELMAIDLSTLQRQAWLNSCALFRIEDVSSI